MMKAITIAAVTAAALSVTTASPTFARDGQIAAGAAGFAAGAIIGGAVANSNRSYYYGPGYVEPSYQPVYSSCRYEREEVVDSFGRVRVRRIRVCD